MSEQNDTQAQETTEATSVVTDVQPDVTAQADAPVQAVVTEKPYDGTFEELKSSVMEQETKTIVDAKGNKIGDVTFQFPGTEKAMKISDKLADSQSEYWEALLNNVVVAPMTLRTQGLSFFDTHKGVFEVVAAADKFLSQWTDRVSD